MKLYIGITTSKKSAASPSAAPSAVFLNAIVYAVVPVILHSVVMYRSP